MINNKEQLNNITEIWYHIEQIIRNNNFKKHNTLLKNFLKIINSTYKDLYYALNHDLNCITMNDKSEISDNQIIYAKYLGIDIINEWFERIKTVK